MSKKKIYIKIDKPIEVGDIVRCVKDDGKCKPGDVRKVSQMDMGSKFFFYTCGSEEPLVTLRWEPVHKLKVGDMVQFCGKSIMTVTAIHPDKKSFDVEGYPNSFFATRQFTLYQPAKHDLKPAHRREFMERAVAEMVVELLDKGEQSNRNRLMLTDWRMTDNSISVNSTNGERYVAELHPNDTWDTLTGVFVALSKATGRKLPDWIYGKVK